MQVNFGERYQRLSHGLDCACHSPARGSVSVIRFVAGSTRLSVSASGIAGIAAPHRAAAANTASIIAADPSGRTASWTGMAGSTVAAPRLVTS